MKVETIYKNGEKIFLENVVGWEINELEIGFELSDGRETWFRKEALENVEITDTKFRHGQKVRYIGKEFPDRTGGVFEISSLMKGGTFTLRTNEGVQLEGAGVWRMGFIARVNELEAVEE